MDSERLNLKVLERDKIALRRLAALEGETMAVVLRRLIRQAAQERGLWPPPAQFGSGQGAADGNG